MHIFPRQIREKSLRHSPQEILVGLAQLEAEIEHAMKELEGMLPSTALRQRETNIVRSGSGRDSDRSLSAVEANIRWTYFMHIFPRQIREKSLHRSPQEILAGLAKLEVEIERGMKESEGMLG